MSKFMKVIAQEGIISWAIGKVVSDQKKVDKFFNEIGHVDEFVKFADFLFDNIKTQYKQEIFRECPYGIFHDEYEPMMSHGKIGNYHVHIKSGPHQGKTLTIDNKPKKVLGTGWILLYDSRRRMKTDGHIRHIEFYIDQEGIHTPEKFHWDFLLENKRVKLPYTQKFLTP